MYLQWSIRRNLADTLMILVDNLSTLKLTEVSCLSACALWICVSAIELQMILCFIAVGLHLGCLFSVGSLPERAAGDSQCYAIALKNKGWDPWQTGKTPVQSISEHLRASQSSGFPTVGPLRHPFNIFFLSKLIIYVNQCRVQQGIKKKSIIQTASR